MLGKISILDKVSTEGVVESVRIHNICTSLDKLEKMPPVLQQTTSKSGRPEAEDSRTPTQVSQIADLGVSALCES